MFDRVFLAHPRSLGEGYFEHQQAALGFAGDLIVAGFACAVHAIVPALFERTASQAICRLHTRMMTSRLSRSSKMSPENADLSVG